MTGPMGSARWMTTVNALTSATMPSALQSSRPPSEPSTSHWARPVSTEAAPRAVTPPTISSASQPMPRSTSFQVKSLMPGRNMTTAPRMLTITTFRAGTQVLRIHSTIIAPKMTSTRHSRALTGPRADRSAATSPTAVTCSISGG